MGPVKVVLYYVGKARDEHANAIAAEFVKRASRWIPCEMREIDPRRGGPWDNHAPARKVAVDAGGKQVDSARLASMWSDWEREGRDVVFVVGGHDGLPHAWRDGADMLLSLSKMTFPHELARAMLAEQIYRALATLRGHPYPR
jgi:23S rRNA (pseudouridine1915-N3)-methyltransferase